MAASNFKTNRLSLEENVEHLEELLINSIKSHLISDVPIATTLSGGLDSSLLTALIKKFSNSEITSYSVLFDEDKVDGKIYNESKFIDRFSSLYNTKRKNIVFNSKKD